MKVVLDTNVLVGCALGSGEVMRSLLEAWKNTRFVVLLSSPITVEVERTLSKPYFAERIPEGMLRAFLELLRSATEDVSPLPEVLGVATHPEDDLILATALGGKADIIVTGDKHLQALKAFEGISILAPREFTTLLGGEQ